MTRYLSYLIVSLVIVCIVSCKPAPEEPSIMLSQVKKFCSESQETYPLRVVGIPFVLSVYEKCAAHNELLLVSWSTDEEYLGLESRAAELVIEAYARFRSNDKTKCMPNHMNFEVAKDDNVATYFHTLVCNQRDSHRRP